MLNKFMLILTLYVPGVAGGVTIAEFTTHEQCEVVGKAWAYITVTQFGKTKQMRKSGREYQCVKVPLVKRGHNAKR